MSRRMARATGETILTDGNDGDMAEDKKELRGNRIMASLLAALSVVVVVLLGITLVFAPKSYAGSLSHLDSAHAKLMEPHDETGIFYEEHVTSEETVRQLLISDEGLQEIAAEEDSVTSDDYDIGREIAWLGVQMAGIASDQDSSLYEPSAYPWNKIDDPRLAGEFAIMDATLGAYGGNCAYASCNQAVCGVIAAVADMDVIPFEAASGNPGYMQAYLASHPETYERVYPATEDELMPGDILVTTDKFVHTALWVGNEMAQTRFPGTSGNIYQAGYKEGDHARYPQIDCLSESDYEWVGYDVYRVIRKNTESEYPSIDYRELIKQAMGQ